MMEWDQHHDKNLYRPSSLYGPCISKVCLKEISWESRSHVSNFQGFESSENQVHTNIFMHDPFAVFHLINDQTKLNTTFWDDEYGTIGINISIYWVSEDEFQILSCLYIMCRSLGLFFTCESVINFTSFMIKPTSCLMHKC